MSLIIGSIFGSGSFDDCITLENEQNSGQLDGKKVNDFTKFPFYKNRRFIQVTIFVSSLTLCCLGLCASFAIFVTYNLNNQNNLTDFIGLFAVTITTSISFTIFLVGVAIALIYKGYDDPKWRQAYRLELESDKLSIQAFIDKHGWANIRIWGFFIPEDQEPLCTKQLLATKILKDISTNQFLCIRRITKRRADNLTLRTLRIINEFYQISKPTLWDAIEHEIFTNEQKAQLLQEFEKHLTFLQGSELLANWRYIKEVGFNKNPKFTSIYDWLEKNQQKYEQIEKLYVQKASFLLEKMDDFSYFSFYEDKNFSPPTQELINTLPNLEASFYTTPSFWHDKLNLLNDWFMKNIKELDDEFKTLAV